MQKITVKKTSKLSIHKRVSCGKTKKRSDVSRAIPSQKDKNNSKKSASFSKAINSTKNLAIEFCPPCFPIEGLASLKLLTQFIETRFGLTISLSISEGVRVMGQKESILLVQLVRELLANTVKHANTDKAYLTVTRDKKHIFVEVYDKGVGFNPEQVIKPKKSLKHGLSIIEEKLGSFGGKMKIESKPGKGTRVCMALPYIQNSK